MGVKSPHYAIMKYINIYLHNMVQKLHVPVCKLHMHLKINEDLHSSIFWQDFPSEYKINL